MQTLVFLLLAYAAATFFPQPGLWLRGNEAGFHWTPQLLLAMLLFCGGICTSRNALRSVLRDFRRVLLGLGLCWILPFLAACVVGLVVHLLGAPTGICLAVVIIAAMPVANSSVGWSSYLGANVATSIALVLAATALSPILSSGIVSRSASLLGEASSTTQVAESWSEGMSLFFLCWVLLPVIFGVLIATRMNEAQSKRVTKVARRISFTVLVLLNYLNGSACLPVLAEEPSKALWPLAAAGLLLLATFLFGRLTLSFPLRRSDGHSTLASHEQAVELAIVLRNTGAALVFAGSALPQFPLISITVISYTMLQHIFVGWWFTPEPDESKVISSSDPEPALDQSPAPENIQGLSRAFLRS